jgi:hypothetical protein
VQTPSPPPFPGGLLTVGNRPPVQPPNVRPIVVGTAGAKPFPGAVSNPTGIPSGLAPLPVMPIHPIRVEEPIPPRFQGQIVLTRVGGQMPGGIQAIQVQTPSPPPFPGAVVKSRQYVIPELRGSESRVVVESPPTRFQGQTIYSQPSGLTAKPPAPPVVVSMDSRREPGAVIAMAGRVETVVPPRQVVIAEPDRPHVVIQPTFRSGTPERPGRTTPPIVVTAPPPVRFQGQILSHGERFGLLPAPPRPAVVFTDSRREPGGIVSFSRFQPAPIIDIPPGRPLIVVQEPLASRREIQQPIFHWGFGIGTPPEAPTGWPVTLYGFDRSVVTLTSLDADCC